MRAGHDLSAAIGPASFARFGTFLGRVDLHVSQLEPQPWKLKRRAGHFGHAQDLNIKSASGLQVGTYERDMVERIYANVGVLRHAAIIAYAINRCDRPLGQLRMHRAHGTIACMLCEVEGHLRFKRPDNNQGSNV